MHPRTEYWREYRRKNIRKKREIERKYRATKKGKEVKQAYMRYWRKANPERAKELRARYRAKFPELEKYKYALESGKLLRQPCEICGETTVDGHHEDYSKPLLVKWLCRKHHALTRAIN